MLLALGLAMDAAAVSAGRSIAGLSGRGALRMSVSFGVFQSAFAAIGWLIGSGLSRWIASWDHWVVFGLLGAIGGKMLLDAIRGRGERRPQEPEISTRMLIVLSIATSIDAFAAGITLPLIQVPIGVSLGLIGIVAFALSLAAARGARWIGQRGGSALEALGGVILLAIGINVLIAHLS